ncbi:MAG: V-type ATP synthase subunit F [Cellulosilyticaceae bacterium]
MYKIGVIGDYDSIYGFGAVGLSLYPVQEIDEARKLMKQLIEEKVAIIYITEVLFTALQKELKSYEQLPLPAIIPIPGACDNTGVGTNRVKKFVEKAVGAAILFNH